MKEFIGFILLIILSIFLGWLGWKADRAIKFNWGYKPLVIEIIKQTIKPECLK